MNTRAATRQQGFSLVELAVALAILAVARGRLEPVVREGQIVPRLLLPLTLTFDHRVADGADGARFSVVFAFQVLPTIIFVAALFAIFYYLGIMQKVVQGMAWVMAKLMGTSGAESLSNTANIFVGQTEAPLLIRPYIGSMTMSEINTIMIGGMATIAR